MKLWGTSVFHSGHRKIHFRRTSRPHTGVMQRAKTQEDCPRKVQKRDALVARERVVLGQIPCADRFVYCPLQWGRRAVRVRTVVRPTGARP